MGVGSSPRQGTAERFSISDPFDSARFFFTTTFYILFLMRFTGLIYTNFD